MPQIESGVSRETPGTCQRVGDSGDACGKPLDTAGYPLWCRKCQASYRRDYTAQKKQMAETRGFAAGCSAMRSALVMEFERMGRQNVNAFQIARWLRSYEMPAGERASAAAAGQ